MATWTRNRNTKMKLSEKLLLSLSRKPEHTDYQTSQENWNLENALSILERDFPNFKIDVIGKEVLDFGCGEGWQCVALAKMKTKYVLGLDTNQETLKRAWDLAREFGVSIPVEFRDKMEDRFKGRFDVVISQNSMEHFEDPIEVMNEMKSALKQDGKILISFGPPWYAPYGSHMHFFTRIPWVNIIFSERTVMRVREYFRNDGATKYEQVESGLNRMTVAKFGKIVSDCGLRIRNLRYNCVKGIDFLGHLPFIRELFINHISCELIKA